MGGGGSSEPPEPPLDQLLYQEACSSQATKQLSDISVCHSYLDTLYELNIASNHTGLPTKKCLSI